MPIYFGSNKIKEIYNGGVPVKEVYNGSNKVFGAGAVIEYGMFSDDSLPEAMTSETFLPDFETSLNSFRLFKLSKGTSLASYGSYTDGVFAADIKNYLDKKSFEFWQYSIGSLLYYASYKQTINTGGVNFDKYEAVLATDATYKQIVYIPEGFILNTSLFLMDTGVVKSRGSDFSYVSSTGITTKLRSRYTVDLLTGEEK